MPTRGSPAVVLILCLASAGSPAADFLPLDGPWRCRTDPSRPENYQSVQLPHASAPGATIHFHTEAPVPAAWAGFEANLRVMASGFVQATLNGRSLGRRLATPVGATFDATEAIRPGATNSLEIAVSAGQAGEVAELRACRLEGLGPVAAAMGKPSLLVTAAGAVVELTGRVINRSGARFEGRVRMQLWRPGEGRPMWERRRDIRLDPERPAQLAEAAQILDPTPWRHDCPYLYRLVTTVTTRDDAPLAEDRRTMGLRSIEVVGPRWLLRGEWTRLAAVATHVPGAWLFNPLPASAPLGPEAELSGLTLPEVLGRCDAAGAFALVEVPAPPGLDDETLAALVGDLTAQAAWHPSIWGWTIEGPAAARVAQALRLTTPHLPIGTTYRSGEEHLADSDFLVLRLQTSAVRRDDDDFARKLDDCRRRFPRKAIVALDQVQPANPGDLASIARSVAARCGHANRRPECAIVGFSFEANGELLRTVEAAFCPFDLKRPGHEVRRDGDKLAVRTWFDVGLRSPVAGWMPCYSLRGARVRWRAETGGVAVASGSVELPTCRPAPLEGGPRQKPRGEARWVMTRPGQVEFVADLLDAAGRRLATRRQRLVVSLKPDGKPELRLEQLE